VIGPVDVGRFCGFSCCCSPTAPRTRVKVGGLRWRVEFAAPQMLEIIRHLVREKFERGLKVSWGDIGGGAQGGSAVGQVSGAQGTAPHSGRRSQQACRRHRVPRCGLVGLNRQLPGAVLDQLQQRRCTAARRLPLHRPAGVRGWGHHAWRRQQRVALVRRFPERFVRRKSPLSTGRGCACLNPAPSHQKQKPAPFIGLGCAGISWLAVGLRPAASKRVGRELPGSEAPPRKRPLRQAFCPCARIEGHGLGQRQCR